jgi:very-short-patch-repair endonuclease
MKIPEIIKLTARKLRINMTKAEVILWKFIRKEFLEYKFLRQKPIYVYTENS